jgi:hypothetical protein
MNASLSKRITVHQVTAAHTDAPDDGSVRPKHAVLTAKTRKCNVTVQEENHAAV